jgi:cyclase
MSMQKITKNVYVETGFHGCNTGFITTSKGIVMIDTPMWPSEAVKWRDQVAKYGTARYLINTEPHGDHFSGNYYYKCPIVAHEGTRNAILSTTSVEQFKANLKQMDPASLPLMKRYTFRPPTMTLTERMTIYLGDHTFQLINMPGHTAYQVAVYIPEEKVVFTSDNIFHKVPAWLHQAMPYEWLESLNRLAELDAEVMVPGHGEVCDKFYIPEMSTIVQAWINTMTRAINKGLTEEEVQKNIGSLLDAKLKGAGYDANLLTMNVARLYSILK